MDNKLLLSTGEDIPFPEAQLTIHQPKITEISYIGEESFFSANQVLSLSKEKLADKDKTDLRDKTDFDIIMSVMNSLDNEYLKLKNNTLMLLTLLFPDYKLKVTNDSILLMNENLSARINNLNYDVFKDIVRSMFKLEELDKSSKKYNPEGKRAERIAARFENRKKNKEEKESRKDLSIFDYYISILSVGLQKDRNQLKQYTVYQLIDEFNRYQKKVAYDSYVQIRLAGGTDIEEVENWMDDKENHS